MMPFTTGILVGIGENLTGEPGPSRSSRSARWPGSTAPCRR